VVQHVQHVEQQKEVATVPDDVWAVRGVPEELRKMVKHYAVDQGIPIGKAVEQLMAYALERERLRQMAIKDYGRLDNAMIHGFSFPYDFESFRRELYENDPIISGRESLRYWVTDYAARNGIEELEAVRHLVEMGIQQWKNERGIEEPRVIPDKPAE
jgi:hypothetical protein